MTVANEYLARRDSRDRAVEHAIQHGLSLLDVPGEDLVDRLAVDALVLDRHLAGNHHAYDRLAAAAAGAAGLVYEDVVAGGGGDVLAELVEHLAATRRVLAGRRADLNSYPLVGPVAPGHLSPVHQSFVLLENLALHRDTPGVGSGKKRCPACNLGRPGKKGGAEEGEPLSM